MNFVEHLFSIWPTSVTTKDGIERAFVNDSIEHSIFKAHLTNVHLLVSKCWILLTVQVLHLFDDGERDVHVCNVLVPLIKHFFRKSYIKIYLELTLTRISSANVANLERGLNILCNNVSDSSISLVPIERLLVFLVTVFPVFALAVLSHLF